MPETVIAPELRLSDCKHQNSPVWFPGDPVPGNRTVTEGMLSTVTCHTLIYRGNSTWFKWRFTSSYCRHEGSNQWTYCLTLEVDLGVNRAGHSTSTRPHQIKPERWTSLPIREKFSENSCGNETKILPFFL